MISPDLKVLIDLSEGNKLISLEDITVYPVGFVGKIRYKVRQADGSVVYTDVMNPGEPAEVALRIDPITGEHYLGDYTFILEVYESIGGSPALCERQVHFLYQQKNLNLVQDFDLFQPKLLYRDETDFDQTMYSYVNGFIDWQAHISHNGVAIGDKTGNTAVFDLIYNGQYYSADYDISYQRDLLFQHDAYDWFKVFDRYMATASASAIMPPSLPQMINMVNLLLIQVTTGGCDCACGTKATMTQYLFAQALLSQLTTILSNGATTQQVQLILQQFLNAVGQVGQVTGTVINIFVWSGGSSSGSGDTVLTLSLDVSGTIQEITNGALANKTIVSVDVDGIERKCVEGTNVTIPASGTFVFVKADGKLKYGGDLNNDQWVKILYK